MARDYIQEAKDARKTFKGTNGEFVEKIGKPAMEAHNKAAKSKALEKKKGFDHEAHRQHNKRIEEIDRKAGIGKYNPHNYSTKKGHDSFYD
jgi:hypothetical protein